MKKTAVSSRVLALFFAAAAVLPCSPAVRSACSASAWADNATVVTAFGPVQGFADNDTTWVWKAIPYARPPVGELRWQAPQDPQAWSEPLANTGFCSWCAQPGTDNGSAVIRGSEDCLYLNIWRPRSAATGLPVYFWIHGGSNKVGSADPYDASLLAGRENMVVVTINYRLGPLGWFVHPALREGQSGTGSSGNFAALDIIKALTWVRDNIEAFGGDPANVTVAGQSAGAVNGFIMMMSPLAQGLFHKVIALSGDTGTNTVQKGEAYADDVIEALLVRDGIPAGDAANVRRGMSAADIRSYLRGKSAEGFLTAAADAGSNPDVFTDGIVIPARGPDVFKDPDAYNQVPVIISSTAEEGKLFLYLLGFDTWPNRLYQFMGGKLTQITRRTDLDRLATTLRRHKSQPGVYCAIFCYGQYRRRGFNAWPTDQGPTDKMSWALALGACHGLDLPLQFGLGGAMSMFGGLEQLIYRPDNKPGWQALSDAMVAYSAQFARTGDPNTEGLPAWSQWPMGFVQAGPRFMLLDADADGPLIQMAWDVAYGR